MKQILSLVLLVSMIVIAKSQTWEGNYTVQAGCNTTLCCCPNGQVTVTRQSGNKFNIHYGAVGSLCTATVYDIALSDPTGFQASIPGAIFQTGITLSSDSRTFTIAYPSLSVCNSTAIKNGAIEQHMNIYIPLVALALLQLIRHFAKI